MWNYNYYVYILTNSHKTVLYTGVTNDLKSRLRQHYDNQGKKQTFAGRYKCHHLIWYEHFHDIEAAIDREKQIKGWSRAKKNNLISTTNPRWDFIDFEH